MPLEPKITGELTITCDTCGSEYEYDLSGTALHNLADVKGWFYDAVDVDGWRRTRDGWQCEDCQLDELSDPCAA